MKSSRGGATSRPVRIYVDESGTHDSKWLVIGMLFVPNHGLLHAELLRAKDDLKYLNKSARHNAKYKETHLSTFKRAQDAAVAERWIDSFLVNDCFFRCIV